MCERVPLGCNGKPVDLLAGKVEGKDLEARLTSTAAGNVTATLQAPYLYSGPNTARVNVVLEFPSTDISFKKEKGELCADCMSWAIASRGDGVVAARFSDTVKLELADKKQLPEFQANPYHQKSSSKWRRASTISRSPSQPTTNTLENSMRRSSWINTARTISG